MPERLNGAVSKTVVRLRRTEGSNPSPSLREQSEVLVFGCVSRSRRWASALLDALVDADVDSVPGLLADGLSELRFDRQPVRAVALRHERAVDRLIIDRSPRVPNTSATSSITTHVRRAFVSPF